MRRTIRIMFGGGRFCALALGAVIAMTGIISPAPGQTGGSTDTGSGSVEIPADATVESLFVDFLHYARMGRFNAADAYARTLLAHPDLDPVKLVEIAGRDRNSVETLLIIIKNSTIGDNAGRVLDLIHKGEHERRRSADRVVTNIKNLAGNPQQESFARRYLAEAGEYAIPLMVQTLLDATKSDLWPRVITTLPAIGKPAVNPLVMALSVRNNNVRLNLIHALGEIGYPQAIPYLGKLIVDETMPEETRAAAARAIQRIETITGRIFPGLAEDMFFRLAEKYYSGDETVRADPRLDEANVWYWDESVQALKRVVVPPRILGQVMAMRCCEEALHLRNNHAEAIALWLAANIRREHRLGMNIESGDPDEKGETDNTRPEVFPRAVFYAGGRPAIRAPDTPARGP